MVTGEVGRVFADALTLALGSFEGSGQLDGNNNAHPSWHLLWLSNASRLLSALIDNASCVCGKSLIGWQEFRRSGCSGQPDAHNNTRPS